jgi:hypothetical protein
MSESQTFFTKMVDELVEFSEHDPELSDGLKNGLTLEINLHFIF